MVIFPNAAEVKALQRVLDTNVTLKLFSNNLTPDEATTTGSFTEVVGGGYAAKTLVVANWVITPGAPGVALYAVQAFNFTGVTNAPGTIYGYYVVDTDGVTLWCERFEASVLPYSPAADSVVNITPRLEAS